MVLTIVLGSGIWNAVSDLSSSSGGDSNTSSTEKGAKAAADKDSCGDRINVGADQGDDGTCVSGTAKGSASTTGSSEDKSDDSSSTGKVAAAGTLPYALEGVWEGDISQPTGTVQSWDVRLDLKGGKKKPGTMQIVDLGCSSNVTVRNAGLTTATLRTPVLTKNNPGGACARLGEVILVQDPSDPDTLTFTWRDLTQAGNVATGEVERVD